MDQDNLKALEIATFKDTKLCVNKDNLFEYLQPVWDNEIIVTTVIGSAIPQTWNILNSLATKICVETALVKLFDEDGQSASAAYIWRDSKQKLNYDSKPCHVIIFVNHVLDYSLGLWLSASNTVIIGTKAALTVEDANMLCQGNTTGIDMPELMLLCPNDVEPSAPEISEQLKSAFESIHFFSGYEDELIYTAINQSESRLFSGHPMQGSFLYHMFNKFDGKLNREIGRQNMDEITDHLFQMAQMQTIMNEFSTDVKRILFLDEDFEAIISSLKSCCLEGSLKEIKVEYRALLQHYVELFASIYKEKLIEEQEAQSLKMVLSMIRDDQRDIDHMIEQTQKLSLQEEEMKTLEKKLLDATCIRKPDLIKPLVYRNSSGELDVDQNILQNHMSQFKRDRMAIIIIVGVKRKGKSFIGNFLVDHMEQSWNNSSMITEFKSSGGHETETVGLNVLCKGYKKPDDTKTCVLVMDSQGIFDKNHHDDNFVFGLSAQISSVLIYNIDEDINKNDLDHLKIFAEGAKLDFGADKEPPFQVLVLLIRNFHFAFEFGWDGGKQYVENHMKNNQEDWADIKMMFSGILCFVIPSPGEDIRINKKHLKYEDAVRVADEAFLRLAKIFARDICEIHCKPKAVPALGNEINGYFIMQQIEGFANSFQKDQKVSIHQATVMAKDAVNREKILDKYKDGMQNEIDDNDQMAEDDLTRCHEMLKDKAMTDLHIEMGNQQQSDAFKKIKKDLEEQMELLFVFQKDKIATVKKLNADKNLSGDPAVLKSAVSDVNGLGKVLMQTGASQSSTKFWEYLKKNWYIIFPVVAAGVAVLIIVRVNPEICVNIARYIANNRVIISILFRAAKFLYQTITGFDPTLGLSYEITEKFKWINNNLTSVMKVMEAVGVSSELIKQSQPVFKGALQICL